MQVLLPEANPKLQVIRLGLVLSLIYARLQTNLHQDKAYLHYKGVFSMPRKETCDELLRAYFHHVHPIMPVIDATTLPHLYPSGDGHPYNLILLWSIFFAAANVRSHLLRAELQSS